MLKSRKMINTFVNVGHSLSLARRRRRISMKSMAERINTSVATLGRMEKGDPTVSWGSVISALEILGFRHEFEKIVDSSRDELGLGLMDEDLPLRIRSKKITKDSGAL